MSDLIVPVFPANPTIVMPIHGEFGFGESPTSWAAWCCLHAADYEEANRLFCLLDDKLFHRIWQGGRGKPAGSPVGSDNGKGYLRTRLRGRNVQVHNLVWLLQYGHWPRKPQVLDHIDGNKSNNSISNLREVTQQFNSLLGARAKTGSTLPYGVSISTIDGNVYAHAMINDENGKLHNNYIPINDPSKREAAIDASEAWWWIKHKVFHPYRHDYAPGDLI